MAQKIKGITIEIEGNTTKLGESLKSVNSQLYSVNSELKQVDKALKLDPTNIDLLRQKQTLLGDAIQQSTSKLDQLKLTQSQIDSGQTQASAEEYRELEREIVLAEANVRKYKEAQDGVNESIKQAQVDKLNGQLEGISKTLDENTGKLGSFAKAWANFKEHGIENMLKGIVNGMKDFASEGIEYNARMETINATMTNMLGSSEDASQALENIRKTANSSSFSFESLANANKYLLATGESGEKANEVIKALGDAVAYGGGGNDELERMAQNLQQIKNVGKASAQDIKQFANAGIDVYGTLADYLGVTTEEVKDMTISYDDLTNALSMASNEGGKFYGAMESQSNTYAVQVNKLKNSWSAMSGAVMEGFSSMATGVMPIINDMLADITDAIKKDGLEGGLKVVISYIPTLVDKLKEIILKLVDVITDNLPMFIQSGIEIILKLVVGLVKAIPKIIAKIPEVIGSVFKGFFNVIAETNWLELGTNIIKGIVEGFLNITQAVKNTIKKALKKIEKEIKDFFGIASPSKLMKEEVGKYLAEGIAVGFKDDIPNVVRQVQGAMSDLNSGIEASVNPTINPTANTNPLIIQIDNFNNTRGTDVQQLAEELEFYRRNSALAMGGN